MLNDYELPISKILKRAIADHAEMVKNNHCPFDALHIVCADYDLAPGDLEKWVKF
jgi:hypothetical protein